MLRIVLTVVQVVASMGIIGLVLLQRGKGAEAGAGFGAGASGTVFGARGATTALSRATAIFAAIFMLNSLALAYMGTRQAAEQPKTILEEAAQGANKGVGKSAPASGSAPATAPAGANGPPNGAGGAPPASTSGAPPASTPPASSTGAPSTGAPAPTTAPAAPTAPQK
jgi:preprotein translocase subunit SecG